MALQDAKYRRKLPHTGMKKALAAGAASAFELIGGP
jgi:hypothetical protein